ncbi:hypothetical protein L3Q82_015067 [Scortum barcoo]|uniref:Uncharacterized protein n=1 Tax=Scortum barcoo TaxID=214431 RepID=A0ACB8VSI2_9TELE|nr:hypothetical protein L3Q82_015067 [Scortum barcoo]
MSLVAYGSSDESDSEETSTSGAAAAPESRLGSGGLFSVLPAPKKSGSAGGNSAPSKDRASNDDPDPQLSKGGLFSSLPKPRKRTEPVKITVPQIQSRDSDSDDDEPAKKKLQSQRQEPKGPKPGAPAQGLLGSSASPSAIKAAAKSAALQLARQIATDDQDNEEEDISPQNYFSLGESSQPLVAMNPASQTPLSTLGGTMRELGYYNETYYQDPNSGLAEAEEPGHSAMFDDEAFMRLQGKRNRGKEEVKFLEIKGDDQLSGNQQWMTKNMTEEKQTRQSFSKKKGEQPTGQQRRKHQITYLIHQAKERELELKNNWAENKLTRRQTQAKYGF